MTTISIPNGHGETIVGILEKRPEIDANRPRPRLVLIAHGVLGHKNYLFQRLLSQKLPYSNFRLDFRGNGDSSGQPGYANIAEDVEDLEVVARYFENEGYDIWAIVGHSRGAIAGLKYATTCKKPLAHFVNVSGRYIMNDPQIYQARPAILEGLKTQGYFDWNVKQRDRIISVKVTQKELDRFFSWDNSHIRNMPKTTSVLTCHGIADNIVPLYNAVIFSNMMSSHTLSLIPDADHNFKGKYEEVVNVILEYFAKHEASDYEKAMVMGQHISSCTPRWIDVEGVKNFRDIGGWPLKDGSGYIREKFVFRCGHLANITPQGIKTLQQLNVTSVFDFRSNPEIAKQGLMPTMEGVTRYPSAMFTELDYSPSALAERWQGYFEGPKGFPKVYLYILDRAKESFRNIFLRMIESHSRKKTDSVVIHCTAGKDRTGVFIMLLLGLCGVDDDVIANEYALSNLGHWEDETELAEKAKRLGISVENLRMLMTSPYSGMRETIRQVKEKYGSIEGYIRTECKLSDAQIEALRDLMVIRIPFEHRQLSRSKL